MLTMKRGCHLTAKTFTGDHADFDFASQLEETTCVHADSITRVARL
jgi:hypothetical protein